MKSPREDPQSWVLAALLVVVTSMGFFWVATHNTEGRDEAGSTEAAEQVVPTQEAALPKRSLRQSTSASGSVLGEPGGRALARATVLLSRKGIQWKAPAKPGGSPEPIVVITDKDGRWRAEPIPTGSYVITATMPGYVADANIEVDLSAEGNSDVPLVLKAGGQAVVGRIEDIGGGAIGGALVIATLADDVEPYCLYSRRPVATWADDQGRFRIDLPQGDYRLSAHHPDYVPGDRLVLVSRLPRTADFWLIPASVIEGTVRSAAGDAVAGATVTALLEHDGFAAEHGTDRSGTYAMTVAVPGARSDEAGRFTLRGLAPGQYALDANTDSGLATTMPAAVSIGIADRQSVDLRVESVPRLSGVAVDAQDPTRVLAGIAVAAIEVRSQHMYVAPELTDIDGYFEFLGLDPGDYVLGAVGERWLPSFQTVASVASEPVDGVRVALEPGRWINGRVTPAVRARVEYVTPNELSLGELMNAFVQAAMMRTTTTADGLFELGPFAPGKATLLATAEGGSMGRVDVLVEGRELENIEISMSPSSAVRGQVIDASGRPVADAFALLEPVGGDRAPGGLAARMINHKLIPLSEDGRFVALNLPAGRYQARVIAPTHDVMAWADREHEAQRYGPIAIEVAVGRDTELTLAVEARDRAIEGVVRDSEGRPVVDAWVTVRSVSAPSLGERGHESHAQLVGAQPFASEGMRAAERRGGDSRPRFDTALRPILTDGAGKFRIAKLAAGDYQVYAQRVGAGQVANRTRTRAGTRIEIQLEKTASLIVDVGTDEILLGRAIGPTLAVARSQTGRLRFGALLPGPYRIKASSATGYAVQDIVVAPGDALSISLPLRKRGQIHGQLIDAQSGEPISGASIHAVRVDEILGLDPSALWGAQPKTDQDGRFTLDGVAWGRVQVIAFHDVRDRACCLELDLLPGQTLDGITVKAVSPSRVPAEQRGWLGADFVVTSYGMRPRPPGVQPDPAVVSADDGPRKLWVASVRVDGPAAQSGVQPGDEIVSIDGVAVGEDGPWRAALRLRPDALRTGSTVLLAVRRGATESSFKVTAVPFRPQLSLRVEAPDGSR